MRGGKEMARTVITQEIIRKMNELYLEIGTYSGVSRAMGGSPSASTVKKYIIKDYISEKEAEKNRKKFNPERLEDLKNVDDNFWDKFCIQNWGELCTLSEEEIKEIAEFCQKELVI